MGSLPWVGLIVFFAGIVAGAAIAFVRGRATYRVSRSFPRQLDAAVAATMRRIDGIAPRVAKATATAEKLEEARARLEESAASAKVLFAAFGEALALVRRVTAFVPR